ncbi:hypothetical protein [Vibrio sp. SCSIO 43137]|uniref:hypothetical protein n=1 Tax=Vibrio sp. SCSIO 43137 TaxID=3021011 RepID=UPI002307B3DB|nr:hypothetical protein [Vibrio sp. SCSIO 43137]WCE30823.1 hypothetical protein PK654_06020 [Vibrio sp. SCSIO 43137]
MQRNVYPLLLSLPLFLIGCGGEGNSSSSQLTSSIDASSPTSVAKLGNNYSLSLAVASIKPLSDSNFNVDTTVFSEPRLGAGSFAKVHGIVGRNYKTLTDAEITFSVTATTNDGKSYPVTSYNLYYENFASTTTPAGLAIAKVENNINNVILWANIDSLTINKNFVNLNNGKTYSIDQQRPMNLYVRIADKLSNGIQILPTTPDSVTYSAVDTSGMDCSAISLTTGTLNTKGIKHQTCVEAHGYKIPLLIEDKDQGGSEAKVAHVKKVMKYYLDNFSTEVTKAIFDSKATMAFFYDEHWSGRTGGEYLSEAYRFQDLFATETTTTDGTENKPDLTGKRDAAFEEIIHFVHDYGIMHLAITNPSSKWAQLQKELDQLNEKALRSGNYYPNGKNANIVSADLDAESYDQEYLAYSLYAYYDLNYKTYTAQELKSATYIQLQANDPEVVSFMNKYFPSRADVKAKFPGYPNN